MTRSIWYVDTDDSTLTVIAESQEEAVELAGQYCDDDDPEFVAYQGGETFPRGAFRWVGFWSRSDAHNQALDLDSAGADHVLMRVTYQSGAEVLWEVGAKDEDWCRLPAGVLCGGDE